MPVMYYHREGPNAGELGRIHFWSAHRALATSERPSVCPRALNAPSLNSTQARRLVKKLNQKQKDFSQSHV